jgi:hypothetical protein
VSVVTGSGQTLRADRSLLGPRAGLERVEEAEANRKLQLGVTVDLDIGTIPEVVEVGTLVAEETIPAVLSRLRDRRRDLVDDRLGRAPPRPPVSEELDNSKGLLARQVRRHEQATDVREALRGDRRVCRPVDDVVHRRGHLQPGRAGRMLQHNPRVARAKVLRLQW